MHTAPLADQIAGVAILADPVRRSLYHYVVGRHADVGRDEAARAVQVSRALAAFHLDKLVGAGLLETSYRRLTKRRGPGAGRPAKLYRRSSRQFSVSLPPRNYELCARVLADALAGAGAATLANVKRTARRLGKSLAVEARRPPDAGRGRQHRLRAATALLAEQGFDPQAGRGGVIRLGNCPFAAVAREQKAVVCGTTLALVEGIVAGMELRGVEARAVPQNGSCCVAVMATKRSP